MCVYSSLGFYLEYSSLWYGDEDNMSGDEPLDDICAEIKHIYFFRLFRNLEKTKV